MMLIQRKIRTQEIFVKKLCEGFKRSSECLPMLEECMHERDDFQRELMEEKEKNK